MVISDGCSRRVEAWGLPNVCGTLETSSARRTWTLRTRQTRQCWIPTGVQWGYWPLLPSRDITLPLACPFSAKVLKSTGLFLCSLAYFGCWPLTYQTIHLKTNNYWVYESSYLDYGVSENIELLPLNSRWRHGKRIHLWSRNTSDDGTLIICIHLFGKTSVLFRCFCEIAVFKYCHINTSIS